MRKQAEAEYASVLEMAQQLKLSPAAYLRAMQIACLTPDRADWVRYIDRFLIAVGAALIVAGIAAFFAWNWSALSHMTKFALIQGGIVAAVAAAWRFGLDSGTGRASSTLTGRGAFECAGLRPICAAPG